MTVDATEIWNEGQAITFGRALQDAGIVWLEEPVSHQNLAGLAHLSDMLDVHIAAAYTFLDWTPSENLGLSGGEYRYRGPGQGGRNHSLGLKIAGLVEAREIPVVRHVTPEAHVRLLAAAPNIHLVAYIPCGLQRSSTRL